MNKKRLNQLTTDNISLSLGFSLIELIIVLAVLLIIVSLVISSFTSSLRTLRQERGRVERDADLKRALELMTVELGQAGVTPDILPQGGTSATIGSALTGPTSSLTLSQANGFYPGRPIIIQLPENDVNSEIQRVSSVSGNILTLDAATTKSHNTVPIYTSSPMLPNMFGILNPPPSGTTKTIAPNTTTLSPVRLGFIGDILNDGNFYYVEYTYKYSARTFAGVTKPFGTLYRSITPINANTSIKATAFPILDNVTDLQFTLTYASTAISIPTSVAISMKVQTDTADARLRTGTVTQQSVSNLYSELSARAEVSPQGTSAASLIALNGAEDQLRNMMPICSGASYPGAGYPPCSGWTGVWATVRDNFAGKKYDNSAAENLP